MDPEHEIGVLFFDLDGVIIDSKQGVESCLNKTLLNWKTVTLADEEVVGLIGPPLEQVVPRLLLDRGIHESNTSEFINDFRKIYGETLESTPLMQDMKETLHALAVHRTLCIVTSKPESQANQIIQARNLTKYFSYIVGSDPLRPTTKTELLSQALTFFRFLDLSDSWMIGDRYHDIDAANDVGIKSIGVTWGYGDYLELHTARATQIVTNPVQLLEKFL